MTPCLQRCSAPQYGRQSIKQYLRAECTEWDYCGALHLNIKRMQAATNKLVRCTWYLRCWCHPHRNARGGGHKKIVKHFYQQWVRSPLAVNFKNFWVVRTSPDNEKHLFIISNFYKFIYITYNNLSAFCLKYFVSLKFRKYSNYIFPGCSYQAG